MSDIDPRLLEAALREVRAMRSLAAAEHWDGVHDEDIVGAALGIFEIRAEWQSLAHDDVNGSYPDDLSTVCESDTALIALLGGKVADRYRQTRHRFVLQTDWQDVDISLGWEPR